MPPNYKMIIKHIDKWNSNLEKLRWKKPYFMKIPIDLPLFPPAAAGRG